MCVEWQNILVEVCVGSMADVVAATTAGADRVELCAGLELGGLTPSIGAVETVLAQCSLPVVVMLRPRAGGFCYDRDEFAAMLLDTERFLSLGAGGIVFGILDRNGHIDAARVRELIDRAGAHDAVFHRAFDFVADWRAELDVLMELGCTRVLTSGGQPTAAAGAATLRAMIAAASGRIEILPGGGIRADNVSELVRSTPCSQVHLGPAAPGDDGSLSYKSGIELNDRRFANGTTYRAIDGSAVSDAISALRSRTIGA
jgi:copper homeostasis protein CutC